MDEIMKNDEFIKVHDMDETVKPTVLSIDEIMKNDKVIKSITWTKL